jgi:hypothetical protein
MTDERKSVTYKRECVTDERESGEEEGNKAE